VEFKYEHENRKAARDSLMCCFHGYNTLIVQEWAASSNSFALNKKQILSSFDTVVN
jgi:hypothetical protein